MRQTVSFSGGKTSAYLSYLMRKSADLFLFADTGFEHPKTYDFIRKVNREFGLDCHFIRLLPRDGLGAGLTYERISDNQLGDFTGFGRLLEKYGVPSAGAAFCTSKMKGEIMDKYRDDLFGKGNYETWRGIRADEPHRLSRKPRVRYLADISNYSKQDVNDWWDKQPFNLDIPDYLGNCVLCVKKGLNRVECARRAHPEMGDMLKKRLDAARVLEGRADLGLTNQQIFRQHHSLDSIEKLFADVSTEELLNRIRKSPPSKCEESCEPE